MAWIESHQAIEEHPKLYQLSAITGLEEDICIAKLHRLWWWSLKYAEDGDLSKFTPEQIAKGIKLNHNTEPKAFFSALIESHWIDQDYFIHDWLDYAGRYLKTKYHTANPSKYQQIIDKYLGRPKGKTKGTPLGKAKKKEAKPIGNPPTYLPTLTYLNLPEWFPKETFESFLEMRKKIKKPATEKAVELIIKKLESLKVNGNDPKLVLEQSIRNSWQDVFELRKQKKDEYL